MEPTEEEKAKAFRSQLLLYLIMGIFIFAPFVLYWMRRR
jgi:hypothetical protein